MEFTINNMVILILGTLGTTAAILQIISFVKNKDSKSIINLILILLLAGGTTYLSIRYKDIKHKEEIVELKDKLKNESLINDAKITLDGLEKYISVDYSQAVLELGKIVDFFSRHKDIYESYYNSYSKMENSFSSLHNEKIKEGLNFSIYEEKEINSATKSGIDLIESIIKNNGSVEK